MIVEKLEKPKTIMIFSIIPKQSQIWGVDQVDGVKKQNAVQRMRKPLKFGSD
jgi:hypothetical protein